MKQALVLLAFMASANAFAPKTSFGFRSAASFKTKSASKLSMAADDETKRVVVIGNGMVGQRFMENLLKIDNEKKCTISTFCEEPRAAYNRVKLTSYFETRDPSDLSMTSEFDEEGKTAWYDENNVEIFLKDKVVSIDTEAKTVTSEKGRTVPYDAAIMATGSFPFVPPINVSVFELGVETCRA